MTQGIDAFLQYFQDLRFMLEVIAVASVLAFIVIAVLGSIVAWQLSKLAHVFEVRLPMPGPPQQPPPLTPFQYGPWKP